MIQIGAERVNPFAPDSAKSKIDKNSKITKTNDEKKKQNHSKVLLNSVRTNGDLRVCPEKLENFASPKVSLQESKGQWISSFIPISCTVAFVLVFYKRRYMLIADRDERVK